MSEASYFAVLHYTGHGFSGWQRQPAARTVQGELEAALERLARRRTAATAAGRTDAGVHALGQVVSFRLPRPWLPVELLRALRALTPPDIWVARVGRAPDGFNARKHARSRRYRYAVGCDAGAASPFRRPYEWALGAPLDRAMLDETAHRFRGEHDFRAFSAAGQPRAHHRCRVLVSEWHPRPGGEGFIFTVEADRFLHRMVRFLVGVMVDVARERRPSSDIPRLLRAADNSEASTPAPPQGLYFIGARYPELEEGVT